MAEHGGPSRGHAWKVPPEEDSEHDPEYLDEDYEHDGLLDSGTSMHTGSCSRSSSNNEATGPPNRRTNPAAPYRPSLSNSSAREGADKQNV